MAPKRCAVKSAGPAAKKAKVADTKVIKEPFVQACDDIIALLAADASIDATTLDTLRVAAPLALRVPKAERQGFEATVAVHIADRIQQLDKAKKQEIATTEASIAEVDTEKAANENALKEITEKGAVLKQASEASRTAVSQATKAVAAAKEVHVKAQQAVGSMDAERERHMAQMAERIKFTALKEKLIEGIYKIMMEGGEESLKEKPEQRGPIAQQCIELVDRHLNKCVQDLDAEIRGYSDRLAVKTKAVEEAAAESEKAQKLQDDKESDMITAQNAYVETTEGCKMFKESEKALAAKGQSLAKMLTTLQGESAVIQSTVTRFNAIVEGGEAATNVQPVETETQPTQAEAETQPAPAVAEMQPVSADVERLPADTLVQRAEADTATVQAQ